MSSSKFVSENGYAYIGEYYEVRRYKQFHYLSVPHDGRGEPTTLEKVIEDIKTICEEAAARGYNNDDKWQIVKCEITTVYDAENVFCTSSETKRVIALYDNGVVTKF